MNRIENRDQRGRISYLQSKSLWARRQGLESANLVIPKPNAAGVSP
jgi:hypothetical protein